MNPSGTPENLTVLLAAITGGDQRALAKLYDLTAPVLYGRLLRILRRPDWAREALQDCYIRVWRRSVSYSPERGDPINWLTGIARFRALDLLQDAQRRSLRFVSDEECGVETPDSQESAEERTIREEKLERLARCMQILTQKQRRCILLAYYEGYSHQELSQAMDAPLGTVKAWLRRGVVRLRECLSR
jgi:RNA polymerase sigma-70 factor (ECF subfamily)